MYEPLKVFSYIGGLFMFGGIIISGRFIYLSLVGDSGQHIQSLLLSAILLIVGFQIFLIGIVADSIANNRRLLEKILYNQKNNRNNK